MRRSAVTDEGGRPQQAARGRRFPGIENLRGLLRPSKSADSKRGRSHGRNDSQSRDSQPVPVSRIAGPTDRPTQNRLGNDFDASSPEHHGSVTFVVPAEEANPQIPPPTTGPDISLKLWNNAYDRVKRKEKKLVDSYEEVLSTDHGSGIVQGALSTVNIFIDCDPVTRLARMNDMARRSLEKTRKHRRLEGGAEAVVSFINGLSTFISSLLDSYPPAALAWSGVSAALPFLVGILQTNRQLAEALEYMLARSRWYLTLCRILLRDTWDGDKDMRGWTIEVEEQVTALLEAFLCFQIKCVCRCYQAHPLMASVKDAMLGVSWSDEVEAVKTQERLVEGDIGRYCSSANTEILRFVESSGREQVKQLFAVHASLCSINESLELQRTDKQQKHESELTGMFKTTPYVEWMELTSAPIERTCEWFCSHDKFRLWLEGNSGPVLLVSAGPGCGKSVVAKHLVKDVIPRELPSATVCYFFFKDSSEQNKLSDAYAALLHRLFRANSAIADLCKDSIRSAGKFLTEHPYSLWEIFTEATGYHKHRPVVCILDALDECHPDGLETLARHMSSLDPSGRDVRFLLTTRDYPSILDRFKLLRPSIVHLAGGSKEEIEKIQEEIALVVDHRLRELARKKGRDLHSPEMTSVAEALHLRGQNQRTYIWVTLVFEVLEAARPSSDDEWENLVNTLPQTVTATYDKLLRNVKREQQGTVQTMLRLVLVAYRPLTLRELNIALNVRDHPRKGSIEDLHLVSDKEFREMMIQTCGHFVTEYRGKVYFIHQTAKEYLLGARIEAGPARDDMEGTKTTLTSIDGVAGAAAHASMAESCLAFLSLDSCMGEGGAIWQAWDKLVQNRRVYLTSSIKSYPFAEYVTRFWPSHFRHCQRLSNGEVVSDVGETFRNLYRSIFSHGSRPLPHPAVLATLFTQRRGTLLHDSTTEIGDNPYPSYFDWELQYLAERLGIFRLEKERKPISMKRFDPTGLIALWGHVGMLQERVGSPEVSAEHAVSRLSWSGWFGRLGVTRSTDTCSTFPPDPLPLVCAVAGKSIPCLEHLLGIRLSVDSRGKDGKTPLHWAVELCDRDVVKFLLDHGARVDSVDDSGNTPMQILFTRSVYTKDYETIARMLVSASKGAELDSTLCLASRRDWGLTESQYGTEYAALRRAQILSDSFEEERKESFITWLISQGANPNAENGQPLTTACERNLVYGVVCLLRGGADPNLVNPGGVSVLMWCVFWQNSPSRMSSKLEDGLEIIKLLLAHQADPDMRSDRGKGALHLACKYATWNRVLVVSTLLTYDAGANAEDTRGLTPPREVISNDPSIYRDDIISLLLHNGANPNLRDKLQRTPLHHVCRRLDTFNMRLNTFHMRLLLDYGADVAAVDADGNTPLHLVFKLGRKREYLPWLGDPSIEKAIRMLLQQGALMTVPNKKGITPLQMARRAGWHWHPGSAPAASTEDSVGEDFTLRYTGRAIPPSKLRERSSLDDETGLGGVDLSSTDLSSTDGEFVTRSEKTRVTKGKHRMKRASGRPKESNSAAGDVSRPV